MNDKNKICELCGGTKYIYKSEVTGQYLCSKHRQRLTKYGGIEHTKYDKNEIIIKENYALVILNDAFGNYQTEVEIDIEDIGKIKDYKWSRMGVKEEKYYAVCYKENLFMHRAIMNITDKNILIDHRNHNGLDNKKNNLRISDCVTNGQNKKLLDRNTSGVTGVDWHKQRGKWRVRITVNKKEISLGLYDDFDEAVAVRKQAQEQYFKEFSYDFSMQKNNQIAL
jgi:hypothetical protein